MAIPHFFVFIFKTSEKIMKYLIFLISFFAFGCAAKQKIDVTPLPLSREVMLSQFEPSGSPCTDFLSINFLNVGCDEVVTAQPEEYSPSPMFLACQKPQPGATDEFSTATWVFVSAYDPKPPPIDTIPVCIDSVGLIGIHPITMNELTGTSPALEYPIYEGE